MNPRLRTMAPVHSPQQIRPADKGMVSNEIQQCKPDLSIRSWLPLIPTLCNDQNHGAEENEVVAVLSSNELSRL